MNDDWLTKEQTAALLSCSGKTVERYQRRGMLEHARRPQPGSPPIVVFSTSSVEAVRTKLRKPAVVLQAVEPSRALAVMSPDGEFAKHFAALATFAQGLSDKYSSPVYVSLSQAARLTGLSHETIRAGGREGAIKTRPFGRGVRYRRADLEAL